MSIAVACKCGKKFAAKDELAGKTVRCPQCKQPLKIPATQSGQLADAATKPPPSGGGVASLFDEVGFHVHEDEAAQRCPACDAELSDHAVICVGCGYDLQTGKFVKASGVAAASAVKAEGAEGVAQLLLSKAETTIKQDKTDRKKDQSEGMPLWMILTALVIVVTFAGTMMLLERKQALLISGVSWMGICFLVSIYYNILILVVAFRDSTSQGLLCMFIPFYQFYYIITHWDECGTFFLIAFAAGMFQQIGWGVIALAGLVEEPEAERAQRPAFDSQQIVACATMEPDSDLR